MPRTRSGAKSELVLQASELALDRGAATVELTETL